MHDTTLPDSEFVTHVPCDSCGSSDGNALYTDGHTHCFVCGVYGQSDNAPSGNVDLKPKAKAGLIDGEFVALDKRKLTITTMQKWGVKVGVLGNEKVILFPYYDGTGQMVAQKARTPSKEFSFLGDSKKARLFGQQLWSKSKRIVITEGEIDAMSVSQVLAHKWPVVSVSTGSKGAKKDLQKNLSWLEENFEEIVLMFDNDEPGQLAAQECSTLFSPGKVKIAKLPLKDANEMLQAGRVEELTQAMWNAQAYRPDGVLTVGEIIPHLDDKPEYGLSTPWPSMDRLTHALKPSQMWTWTSGSGMGKTEFFKDLAAHILKTHNEKVGVIFLEEEGKQTLIDIAGKLAGQRFDDPDVPFDKDLRNQVINDLQTKELLYLYNEAGNDTNYDAIKSVIRYMVAGLGCRFIFLDHITSFIDGAGNDANALMERIMKELASMVRQYGFNLHVISHIRKSDSTRRPAEEGGRVKIDDMKGSGAIKQWSNFVIGLERNQQAEDPEEKNTTTVRLLKSRDTGKNVGKIFQVRYDADLGVLRETDGITEYNSDNPF